MGLEENPVGKPDAVAPHVRFDERGWETRLYATAPVLDSTVLHNFYETNIIYCGFLWLTNKDKQQ